MNKWNIKEYQEYLNQTIKDRLTVAGEVVVSATKKNISGAGDPSLQAVDTGMLLGSINKSEVTKESETVQKIIVGTPVRYAPYVFLGTTNADNTVRMRARPSLQRALLENGKKIEELLGKAGSTKTTIEKPQ